MPFLPPMIEPPLPASHDVTVIAHAPLPSEQTNLFLIRSDGKVVPAGSKTEAGKSNASTHTKKQSRQTKETASAPATQKRRWNPLWGIGPVAPSPSMPGYKEIMRRNAERDGKPTPVEKPVPAQKSAPKTKPMKGDQS